MLLRTLVALLAVLASVLFTAPSSARTVPTCATPRDAADSLFAWQIGDQPNIDLASRCLDPKGRTRAQRQQSARHVRAVFDAEGAFVRMDSISDSPDYSDPATQKSVVVPHSKFPSIVIRKIGKSWLWSADSLDFVDNYYLVKLATLDRVIDAMPPEFLGTILGVAYWQYLALLLLFLAGFIVRKVIEVVVAARLKQLTEKFGQKWASSAVDVAASPGATLVTAFLLRVGYPQLRLPVDASGTMLVVVRVLVTVSIIWAIYRAVDLLAEQLMSRAEATESKLDDQLVPLIRKSLKVVVFIAGVLFVLQNLNVNVRSLLAGLGIGGLAFALAAKDTLANLFGSITIFVDSPFQIGDWINAVGVDGTVEEVGFRSTRLRTFYNSVVVVPNAKLADAKIDNYGQREYRRCFVTLGLSYDTTPEQMQAFVEGARAVVQANPLTRKDSYEIHMSGFGAYSLDVMVYFFFKCETWSDELREKHNVFLELMRLAKSLDVAFAFPTQSILIDKLANSGDRVVPDPVSAAALADVVNGYGPGGELARPEGPSITEGKYVPGIDIRRGVGSGEGE
ncbi:mechanosensitive ion channel family protein [Endomicrobium sp. AH-315-J14]|nr:mechanosensitive ion channel family protein [Endomicrobium sp. AH-315-J14]